MADPIITFTKANDIDPLDDTKSDIEFLPPPDDTIGVALHPEDFGSAKAGESTTAHEIHIHNNKDGVSDVDPALGLAITSVTLLQQNSGGTNEEGKEIVELKMAQIKDVTGGSAIYVPVGGSQALTLGDLRGDKLVAPGLPTGTVGHESGGEVLPGTYYAKVSALDETGETLPGSESSAVTVESLFSQTVQDGNSETLDSVTNSKISYAVKGVGTYVNGFQLLQTSGGTIVGNLRLETDNEGSPSGTLLSVNSEKTNVTLQDGIVTSVFFNNEITWVNETNYHLVFVVTSGTGTLKGKATGTTHSVKYYDGTWHDSSNIYDLYCVILGNNKIDWAWDKVTNAETYKLFRSETSGSYGATSMLAKGIETNAYEDKLCEPITGEPLASETVTYGHKWVIEIKIAVNSTANSANAEFYFEARYSKA